MRHALRDFFRRRRLARHIARHGHRYRYFGLEVSVPPDVGVEARTALLRERYEQDEAAMISKYLPPQLPVVELGGSLGVVSRFIRARLAPGVRHVIVEANPHLVETCRQNALRGTEPRCVDLVHAAVYHDGPTARFTVGQDELINEVVRDDDPGTETVTVEATTLGAVAGRLENRSPFSLVSDIEGAEYDVFERESEALGRVQVAVVETHPAAYRATGASTEGLLKHGERAGLRLVDRSADVVVLVRRP